jgi:hypothetical protein
MGESDMRRTATGFVEQENQHMIAAETPFEFFTVSYLTRIGNQSAGTLTEFLKGLSQCPNPSVR